MTIDRVPSPSTPSVTRTDWNAPPNTPVNNISPSSSPTPPSQLAGLAPRPRQLTRSSSPPIADMHSPAASVGQTGRSIASSTPSRSINGLTPEIIGGSKEEKLEKLKSQFKNGGLYVRTVSDHHDEFSNTFMPKLGARQGKGADQRYWSSATFIQHNLKGKLHDPHGNRTGLILSADSKLGGFSSFDAATENVPAGADPSQHFPKNFPKFDMMAAYHATHNDEIFSVDATKVTEEEMNNLGIPQEHRAVFDFSQIQARMAGAKASGAEVEPTEAKVCYQPKDVLGIYVNMDSPDSRSAANELRDKLKQQGFDVPLMSYKNFEVHEQ